MANALLASLLPSLSGEEPCGPDLELEGDADFMNFLANADAALPSSFFINDAGGRRAREKTDCQFGPLVVTGVELLDRVRDLRVLGALALFAALERRLDDLVDIFETTAYLVENHWEQVHPREQDDDFELRKAAIERLDDDLIGLPFQFMILVRHPRLGALTYRHKLLADGAARLPSEEEDNPAEVARGFSDAPLSELVAARDKIARLVAACATLSAVTTQHLGAGRAFSPKRILPLFTAALALLEGVIAERDPGAVTATTAAPSDVLTTDRAPEAETATSAAPPPGELAAAGDVAAALAGVVAYFETMEPSSPALLLLRQAQQLIGKDFFSVMRVLAPEHFDRAIFQIGGTHRLELPMQRLNEQCAGESALAEPDELIPLSVHNRNAAIALLQKIESFYARNEPSSPIPFLCERARKFCTADFLTILRQILPRDALKSDD